MPIPFSIPGAPQLKWGTNPLEEAQRIGDLGPRPYYMPGTSPMEKAKKAMQKYRDEAEKERKKKEEERRYQQFLEQQKKEAKKIAEQKRKKQKEVDAALRAKKKLEEAEEKIATDSQQAAEEKEYRQWLTNHGLNPDGIIESRGASGLTLRAAWNLKNMLGSLASDLYGTRMSEKSGEIALNKNKIAQAEAHQTMLRYQQLWSALEDQKNLLEAKLYGNQAEGRQNVIYSDAYMAYTNQLKQLIAKCYDGMRELENKMLDKDLVQLNDEFKLSFIRDNGGTAGYVMDEIGGAVKEFFVGRTAKEREEIKKARRQAQIAEYDKYLKEYAEEHNLLNSDGTISAENEQKVILSYIKDRQLENENSLKEYVEAAEDQSESQKFWNVAESYEKGKELYADKGIADWKYWKYQVPGTVGSSFSSQKQMASALIQTVGAGAGAVSAATGWGGPVAPAVATGVSQALSLPLSIMSNVDENETETGETKVDNIMKRLDEGRASELKFRIGLTAQLAWNELPEETKKEWQSFDNYLHVYDLASNEEKLAMLVLDSFAATEEDLRQQSIAYWKQQGVSDEWIEENYGENSGKARQNVLKDYNAGISYTNNEAFKRADKMGGKGLDAQFWMDNFRTGMSTITEVGIAVGGYGKTLTKELFKMTKVPLNKAAAWTRNTAAAKAASKVASKAKDKVVNSGVVKGTTNFVNKAKDKVVNSKVGTYFKANAAERNAPYANGFRRNTKTFKERAKSSFAVGEQIGESLGYGFVGGKIGGATAVAVTEAVRLGSKAVPAKVIASARQLTDNLMHRYQTIYDKILLPETLKQGFGYGLTTARKLALIGMVEGAEEGVQHLNSKQDFASKYGWGSVSISDMAYNDMSLGGRVMNAYGSLFGITESPLENDAEFWQNVKGGFALGASGGFHPSSLVTVITSATNAIRQYRTNELIARAAVLNRELDSKDRASNRVFAELAMQGKESNVAARIRQLYEADRRRENPTYTQEDYDEKMKAANAVMHMAKDKHIRGMLEAKGIKYGTREYATAIADIYNLQDQAQQNATETNQTLTKLNQLYSSEEFRKEVDLIVNRIKLDPGMGIQISRKRVEAGEKAVKDAIQRAKDEGRDVNSAEFAIELEEIRKQAQQATEDELTGRISAVVTRRSKLANRLRALMVLKNQLTSVLNFFNLLHDKLHLKTMRPDAKTILNSTMSLIEAVMKELKEVDPDIDFGKTDDDILRALDNLGDAVSFGTDEIQQQERNLAMLNADAAVTRLYQQQFGYGIVKGKDGKYQYNPTQYQKEQDRARRSFKARLNGKAEEADKIDQEDVTSEYNASEVEGNEYKTRVNKIMQAEVENASLNWMAADAYAGDAASRYAEEWSAEQKKKRAEAAAKAEAAKPSAPVTDPSGGIEIETKPTRKSRWSKNKAARKAKITKNREDYERRTAKAKLIYKKIKKSLRKNAYGSIVPLLPQLAQVSSYLLTKAAQGTYKIAEFIQDLKDVVDDIDIDAVLSDVKNIYAKFAAQMSIKHPDMAKNLSTPEEILSYVYEDLSDDLDVDTFTKVQETINRDDDKIIKDVSTYYCTIVQDGDEVVVCKNAEAIHHANRNLRMEHDLLKSELDVAKDSEEKFKELLESYAKYRPWFEPRVPEYIKYRNVDGITDAIAWDLTNDRSESIIEGIKTRNAVFGVLFDEEYLKDDVSKYRGFDLFVQDIQHFKQQLDQAGYKVIKVGQILYDTESKSAVQADIICIDPSGKVQVIDILSSYTGIAVRWDRRPGGEATYTIHEREKEMLHQVEDILGKKFDIEVNSLLVLPITCDKGFIEVLKNVTTGKIDWQKIKPKNQLAVSETDAKVSDFQISTLGLVEAINLNIDIYNNLLKSSKTEHEPLTKTEWIDQPTLEQYQSYSEELELRNSEIVNLTNDLRHEIESQTDTEKEGEIDEIPFESFEIPQEYLDKVGLLSQACSELDAALNEAPDVTANTPMEQAAIERVYRCLFDAQIALNELLVDNKYSEEDFSNEQELIARALEIMAENPNLSPKQYFVLKWWCDNFVLNTSKSNREFAVQDEVGQYTAFYNTIKGWVDVLQGHLMEDLENSPALQDWYDTLLNVYFAKLLDNAAKFAETSSLEQLLRIRLLDKITEGRNMVDDFNGLFSMRPDKEYPEAPKDEAERVNRLPQKYVDLYTQSTAHSPAYDAMFSSLPYFKMSQNDDFVENVTVTFEIANASKTIERVNDGREYRYSWNKGDVLMKITYQRQDGKVDYTWLPLLFSNNAYSLATNPETIARLRKINNVNKKFAKIVKQALEIVKRDQNKELSYTIGAHKGKILYGPAEDHRPVTEFVFGDSKNKQDLYTITLSKECNLGIASFTIDEKRETIGYDVYAGEGLRTRIGGFDEVYKKQKLKINNGAIVYFYNNGNDQRIGIPIESESIGYKDATRLVYLMEKFMAGNQYENGYDIYELLSQRLYMRQYDKKLCEKNNINNLVTLNNNGTVTIGNTSFDIHSLKNDLVAAISTLRNATDAALLNENLYSSDNKIFRQARSVFRTSNVQEVLLPNGIILTRDDFVHQNTNGSKGSTWLGYMMRNKLLYTTAKGKSYTQIYVDNFKIVDKRDKKIATVEAAAEDVQKQREKNRRQNFEAYLNTLKNSDGYLKYTIDRELPMVGEEALSIQVMQYLSKVLGTDDCIFKSNKNPYISQVEDGYVLGYCTSKMIEICTSAPMSVAYHEAFHRVFELLVPAEVRDKIYAAYRAKHKGKISDRDIAEALADHFVLFMDKTESRKDIKGIKFLYKVYDNLAQYFGLAKALGLKRAYSMMSVYKNTNRGKYANTKVTEANRERFLKLFGEKLNYTVTNRNGKSADFRFLKDSGDVNDVVKSLGFWIAKTIPLDQFSAKKFDIKSSLDFVETLGKPLVDMLCGSSLNYGEKDVINYAFTEIFEHESKLILGTKKNHWRSKMVDVYPKLDALLDKIKDYVLSSITRYTERGDVFSDETLDEETEEAMSKNIEKFDKNSFEDSKLDALPDNVKFFFATVPYMIFEDGQLHYDMSKNKFGPAFMPMTEVWNRLVGDLRSCSTLEELDKRLAAKTHIPMYAYIYNKFHELYERCYTTDENGEQKINYDAEAYCTSILLAVNGQKHEFIVGMSRTLPDGGKQVVVKPSSMNRDKYTMTKQWYLILISGLVPVFKRGRSKQNTLMFVDNLEKTDGKDIFSLTASFLNDLIEGFSNADGVVKMNGVDYSIYDSTDLNDLKNTFVDTLNDIGIVISREALDYMLSDKYACDDAEAFGHLLTDKGAENIQSFISGLDAIVNANGAINEDMIKATYTRCGFVSELATYASKHRRICIENTALGLNGKKLHSESQNNTISAIVKQLNTRDKNNAFVSRLLGYGYNLSVENGFETGSIILEHIQRGDEFTLKTCTYIGSRSDNRNDNGSEYKEEPAIDDYMNKMAILLDGGLIFPTLADKGTWMYLTGVRIPGMEFKTVSSEDGRIATVVKNIPRFISKNGKIFIRPTDEVLDRMIAYADTERLAMLQCMEDLGYKRIPNYKKQGRHILTDSEKIKNLHTSANKVEPNGTRFITFSEVAQLDNDGTVKLDKNGNIVTTNLNDPNKSSVEMLEIADKEFFVKKENETSEEFLERRRAMMAYTLNIQYQIALKKQMETGVISSETGEMLSLKSDYLNSYLINALAESIRKSYPKWRDLPPGRARSQATEYCKSLAIASIISDVETRSIISSNEVLRCFVGNPAMFKVQYEGDHIKDNTADLQKRIGGIVSTGEDNAEGLPGIPTEYTCAECEDYEIGAGSESLTKMFVESSIRDAYATLLSSRMELSKDPLPDDAIEKIWEKAYEAPIDDLMSDPDLISGHEEALQKAKKNGERFAKSFESGINVADGQAYISEEMCKNLLRQRGVFTGEVKKAFDLLTGKDKHSWQEKADAYKLIYDATCFVTTKYTAYGFRNHTLNGNTCSDVAVAYYNKYSLAPLFSCMATGKMHDIYEKMKTEGVDMLMMTSAVKLGSQGAVKYNGNEVNEKFNTYKQDYRFLRRQLNTDPEEGSTSNLGTLMVKLVMQNLRTMRGNYTDAITGEQRSGADILKSLMGAIKDLANIGTKELIEEFGIDNNGRVDNKKLSSFLIKELSSRNANKAIIEAVSLNDKGEFNAPIAALSDAKLIESILISHIDKKVVDIVTPGNSFVQRSVFAMEGSSTSGGVVQSDENMSPTINGGERLLMINNDGSMDAVISIDYFKAVLPEGLSFKQARQWLIDHKLIGSSEDVHANTVAYRIPTQAESSIHALRFVDVVPAVQSTIILPAEFTKITGSDKQYQCSNQYNIKNSFNCWELRIKRTISSQAL